MPATVAQRQALESPGQTCLPEHLAEAETRLATDQEPCVPTESEWRRREAAWECSPGRMNDLAGLFSRPLSVRGSGRRRVGPSGACGQGNQEDEGTGHYEEVG
jgi:hypothetical protein